MTDEPDRTLLSLFAARLAAAPDDTAVSGLDGLRTWRQLDDRATQVAAHLHRSGLPLAGGAPAVAVLAPAAELPAALLGVLRAGGACACLDPGQPPGRLAQILGGLRPQAVLAHRSLARRLPPQRVPIVWIDDAAAGGAAPPPPAVAAGGPAWVLYSSTGGGPLQSEVLSHRDLAALVAGGGDASQAGGAAPDRAAIEMLRALLSGRLATGSPAAAGGPGAPGQLAFSLFYFGNYTAGQTADHYRLVREGARFADRNGFHAIWTPERHFHEFGGLYPSPAVMSAAIAAATERLLIRAGSVVLPLHNPLLVAEEWSLVDNLSGGRVGVSFASGWHANDFVLNPGAYADRQQVMKQGIDTVRRLWRGEALHLAGGAGNEVPVRIFPRPVQAELPVWVTAAGSPETFRLAGEVGAGVLTHMLGQEAGEVAAKIRVYRDAWRQAGHAGAGTVTVMLHTYVGATLEQVHRVVRQPLSAYLKTSFGLLRSLAASVGLESDPRELGAAELDLLVGRAYDRYVAEGSGLIGTPDSCARTLDRLRQMEVDEVACLIDFGAPADDVLAGLGHLDELRRRAAPAPQTAALPAPA